MELVKFIRETRQEVNKITWPTRKETTASTTMVLILVVISAAFFWFIDSIISWAVKLVLGI